MNRRSDTINTLIRQNKYTSYLEVGLGDGEHFRTVVCRYKKGVDIIPCPNIFTEQIDSDSFFAKNTTTFDIIFIDGLHHADQVERDIRNAYKVTNKNGIILVHDIKPHNEQMTKVPRETESWTGDVFKAWYGFIKANPHIKTGYFDEKYGLGAIYKTEGTDIVDDEFTLYDLSYESYRDNYLNKLTIETT